MSQLAPLDDDAERYLQAAAIAPRVTEMAPEVARASRRAARAALVRPLEEVAVCEDVAISLTGRLLRVRRYVPSRISEGLPGLVYFHGGGFVLGDLDSHDPLCRQLANRLGAVIVSVDYRLAPEHRFPAAVEDAIDSFSHVIENAERFGIDRARVGIGGDSAGGNLAIAACVGLRRRNMKMPIGQLLAYPVTQCSYDLAAFAPDRSTAALSSADMVWFCTQYVTQASELDDPLCSPLLADLAGLPPAVVVSAEFDVLSPQVLAFVERCRAAGSTVEHHAYSGMFHGFFSLAPIIAQAENAVESATRSYLALTTP